ncbi:MAG: HAD-IIB family hydrolase [Phycisphaerales bacterium]
MPPPQQHDQQHDHRHDDHRSAPRRPLTLPPDLALPTDWQPLINNAAARRPSCDLIALDLDGTLFDHTGRVPPENAAAIDAARKAGIEVVICTGRGFRESAHAIESIRAYEPAAGRSVAPIVNAGGAMITDASAGRTLHRWSMQTDLVADLCDHFAARGRAPLLLKDRDAAGFDYLVIDSGPIEPPTRWWFEHMDVKVKFAASLDADPHPEHTVRVGFAAHASDMTELARSLAHQFEARVAMQHFAAVSAKDATSAFGVRDETIHLLEVFDPQVSKWTAIRHIAAEHDIPRHRIAAIGDEVNDRQMIEGAALGIAMGNAIPQIKDIAHAHTRSHDQAGVAWAIAAILSNTW